MGGVVLGGGGGSWFDDEFGRKCCNRLQGSRENFVVLLYGNPLSVVEEVPNEADMYGLLRSVNCVCYMLANFI